MVSILVNLWISFLAGIFAPLGAICVLPLYPGFLSFLASQKSEKDKEGKSTNSIIKFAWIITFGVITSMFVIGLIFSYILKSSLTNIIAIVSPIAFLFLAVISIFLIFNVDLSKFIPKYNVPILKNASLTSFVFGLFFGFIVLPCNPASLVVLFAISTTTTEFVANLANFLLFGIGMATPLLILAYASSVNSEKFLNFLIKNKRMINFIAGIIMLSISIYYLFFVFNIIPILPIQNIIPIQPDGATRSETGATSETGGEMPEPLIDVSKIIGGGPPKDGIPSIDNPKFVSVEEADKWIEDNELVLVIKYKDTKRVYPLQIMVFHEIVNDIIENDPILITYCPLCGSGIAFEGKINGERVEFGTSGKLYNSNLIMYDRLTDSYWTQIDGRAVVGELTGMKLTPLTMDTVSWGDYKTYNQDAEVLSQDTGHRRNYGRDPYGSYYEDSFLMFPVENKDNRIHAKTPVLGLEIDGIFRAYKEEDVKSLGTIIDIIGDTKIQLVQNDDGTITITNVDTSEEIVRERDFWFAWYAFHPETELYEIG